MLKEYEAIIEAKAKEFDLDPRWIMAIIWTESKGNPNALRFEPNYSFLYRPETFGGKGLISRDTEIITQKISWGLGQIMGAVAREQGHQGLMAELLAPNLNIYHICTLLKRLTRISSNPSDVFAMYNGGPGVLKKIVGGIYPNQSYVNTIQNFLSLLDSDQSDSNKA